MVDGQAVKEQLGHTASATVQYENVVEKNGQDTEDKKVRAAVVLVVGFSVIGGIGMGFSVMGFSVVG